MSGTPTMTEGKWEVQNYKFVESEYGRCVECHLTDGRTVYSYSSVIVRQLDRFYWIIRTLTADKPFTILIARRVSKATKKQYLMIYRLIFDSKAYALIDDYGQYSKKFYPFLELRERDTQRLAEGQEIEIPSPEDDIAKMAWSDV